MVERYDVIAIVAAMLTTAITIGAPVLRLNTTITKLIVRLDNLGKDVGRVDDELESIEKRNHESHRRIWDKIAGIGTKLSDHESRLKIIENEKER